MRDLGLVVCGAVLVGLHLFFKQGYDVAVSLPFKAAASLLFVLTAIVQTKKHPQYFRWVLPGLILGSVGDVLLGLPGQVTFKIGVIAFLLGHVCYVIAYSKLTRINTWITYWHVLIWVTSLAIFIWLIPYARAKGMVIHVLAYVVVISIMVSGALAVFNDKRLGATGRWLILVGSILFYVSDVLVAVERFVSAAPINWLVSIPMYYAAQFMIALSVGRIGPPRVKEGRS